MKKKNIVFRTYQSKVSTQISQLPSRSPALVLIALHFSSNKTDHN